MYKIGIFTIILIIVYSLSLSKISVAAINKKIRRGLIITLTFSLIGLYGVYSLKSYYVDYEVAIFASVNLLLAFNIIGLYRKNKICLFISIILLFVSIYGDIKININMVSPLSTFIIYLKSLMYLDIIWDVFLPIYFYHIKLRNNERLF